MTDLRYLTPRPEMDSNRVVLAEFPRPEAWTEDAACAQYPGDVWFPATGHKRPAAGARSHGVIEQAVAVCRQCPVRNQCLDYATRTDQHHGIWGGLTEAERAKLRRSA